MVRLLGVLNSKASVIAGTVVTENQTIMTDPARDHFLQKLAELLIGNSTSYRILNFLERIEISNSYLFY